MTDEANNPVAVNPQIDLNLEALLAFHAVLNTVEDVAKSEEADTGRYKYRYVPLPAVLDEVKRACQEHGLAMYQVPTALREGMLLVYTKLIHKNGGVIEFDPITLPLPREAQALGSALTYCRRYALLTIFGMGTEDDDGKAATDAENAPEQYGGWRSGAEERIQAEFTKLVQDGEDETVGKVVRQNFRTYFGVGLTDLPTSRHGDALSFVLEAIPATRAAKAAEAAEKPTQPATESP